MNMENSGTIKNYIRHSSGSNRYNLIRKHAKRQTSHRQQKCENCGYDRHVETCHIKPINEFSENDLLSVVNAESNLKLFCPNCHWEHDSKLRKQLLLEKQTCSCGTIKYAYADKCRTCENSLRLRQTKRKVETRPSLEELNHLVSIMPMTHVGKKFGVSDNCIRKWIRHYNKTIIV